MGPLHARARGEEPAIFRGVFSGLRELAQMASPLPAQFPGQPPAQMSGYMTAGMAAHVPAPVAGRTPAQPAGPLPAQFPSAEVAWWSKGAKHMFLETIFY